MKIAFIGCGGFASGNHIPNAAKNTNLEIRALCDLDESRLEALKKTYSPDYATNEMEKVFDDSEVEMVVCSTKPDFRIPVIKAAIESGKHLFVEKPLCYDNGNIGEIFDLLSEAHIKFMVGFNRPYSPMMRDIKPLYRKLKDGGNTTIIYRIIGEAGLWPKHHHDAVVVNKESTIIHEATHIFDLLNWLTDSYPSRIYTAGGGNMDNVITLDYPGDVTAVVISGDNSTAGYPKERLEINSNYGTIIGDNFTETLAYPPDGKMFQNTYPYNIAGKEFQTDGKTAAEKNWEWRCSVTEKEIEYGYYYERQVKVDKGHYGELEFFRNIIENDLPSETDVHRAAAAQIIAARAIESWERRQPVEVLIQ
ncbi:MAG: Gfo/Idh/MocA family oxidoreductase [Kiritimatiellaeota bacterium]|nr:Gfo/Idh/MocA family oxidoreductase [Kiritimatiellota bacterium]